MLHFKQLRKLTKGTLLQLVEDRPVEHLITDSRKLLINPEALFFAVDGARHDGHAFIEDLYHKGIRQFVVEKPISLSALPDANIIQVNSSTLALQQIATQHRNHFDLTVIGITGSNGKTIVKEWLGQMLSAKLKVVKSPKSYNSQIGVPLSVWQIRQEHEIGVFEAGISQVGEMENLEAVIQPQIGIFTMIGTAHDEGFENIQQKVVEKSKLFKNVSKLIYCRDQQPVHEVLKQFSNKELISWGKSEKSKIQVLKIKKSNSSTDLTLSYKGKQIAFSFPFSNDASIENCMHCVAFLLSESFAPAFIQQQVNQLDTVSKRLELKQGANNCYLIDDTYNNDFGGLQIALEFMGQQKHKEKKTVILSDLLQTGLKEHILYSSIADLLHNKGIDRLIGIGEAIGRNSQYFKMDMAFYDNTEDFLDSISKNDFNNELLLIKGAREFHFERIVELLQQKTHGTVLEINLDALTHNLNFYRSKLSPPTKLMVMVKAFAYGSGSDEVANLLQFHRVDYLAVAYADEGVALREHGISIPIMVMNPSVENFGQMIRNKLEPEIYSLSQLKALVNFLKEEKKTGIRIHLKLDTGMHRLGFAQQDLKAVLDYLSQNPRITVSSVFSHLAGADEALHNEFSHHQVHRFLKMKAYLSKESNMKPFYHILNSAGIIRFPEYHFDMVRLGIGLYGIDSSGQQQDQLQAISTLKTTISQIKHIQKGETVGYSRKGVASKDTVLATLAIGYADGFDRRFGQGNGHVLIHGQMAPVVGNVCMDMTMVDITGIPAEEGDEVIIFGKDMPIRKLAAAIGTIPYEILTSVSERVKRVFFTE